MSELGDRQAARVFYTWSAQAAEIVGNPTGARLAEIYVFNPELRFIFDFFNETGE